MLRQFFSATLLITAMATAQVQQVPPLTQIPPQLVPTMIVTVDQAGGGQFTTITAAVNSVPSGTLIKVKAGTYLEYGIDFGSKQLVLRSIDGVGSAIIDGTPVGSNYLPIFLLQNSQTAATVIDGFELRSAVAPLGAGVFCLGTSPTIINNIFTGNSAGSGSAVYSVAGQPTIGGNTFVANGFGITPPGLSQYGGAVFLAGSNATLVGNLFDGNYAAISGGGVHAEGASTLTMTNNMFTTNVSDGDGGAFAFYGGSSVTATFNTFAENTAQGNGGGGYFAQGSMTFASVFDTNLFAMNQASFFNGGGIACVSTTATFVGNTFELNSADDVGGGVSCEGPSAPIFISNLIRKNAAWNHGGGIACRYEANAEIRRCNLKDNDTKDENGTGAGIYVESASVTVRRCTIFGNGRVTSTVALASPCWRGGGIDYVGGEEPASQGRIDANQIQQNEVGHSGFGAGVALKQMGPGSVFVSNIVAKNRVRPGGTCTAAGVLVELCGPFRFANNTMVYNTNAVVGPSVGIGGGLLFSGISQLFAVANCITWGNIAFAGDANIDSINVPPFAPLPVVDFSDVAATGPYFPTGWVAGPSMLFGVNPQFVDPTRDYHLMNVPGQLLRDVGTNAAVNMTTAPTDIDIDGLPRIANFSGGGIVDIGADEL